MQIAIVLRVFFTRNMRTHPTYRRPTRLFAKNNIRATKSVGNDLVCAITIFLSKQWPGFWNNITDFITVY